MRYLTDVILFSMCFAPYSPYRPPLSFSHQKDKEEKEKKKKGKEKEKSEIFGARNSRA